MGKMFNINPVVTNEDYNEDYFNYLADGDEGKLEQLYRGHIFQYYLNAQGDLQQAITHLATIDEKYWKYCYRGLGEGSIAFVALRHEPPGYWLRHPETTRDIIQEKSILIPKAYKRCFYQGLGIGIAEQFAQQWGQYITEHGFYDNKIINQCLAHIEKKYRKDFIKGFSMDDNWTSL